jgi:hypothetical protein
VTFRTKGKAIEDFLEQRAEGNFWPKMEVAVGGLRKLRNEELHNLFSLG